MPPGRGSSLWSIPFHRRILSGSVKYGNTASGGARIRISCSMTSSPSGTFACLHLLLHSLLEAVQSGCPELLEVVAQFGQAFGPGPVDDPGGVTPALEQAGVDEHPRMLRPRRPAELEVRRDLPGGELIVPDEAEDLPPVGLGDGSEGGVHGLSVSRSLRK